MYMYIVETLQVGFGESTVTIIEEGTGVVTLIVEWLSNYAHHGYICLYTLEY